MKKKIKYIAFDGTKFTKEKECRNYDKDLIQDCFRVHYDNVIEDCNEKEDYNLDTTSYALATKESIKNIVKLIEGIK